MSTPATHHGLRAYLLIGKGRRLSVSDQPERVRGRADRLGRVVQVALPVLRDVVALTPRGGAVRVREDGVEQGDVEGGG